MACGDQEQPKQPKMITIPSETVMTKDNDAKLTVRELAEALYEGTPHLSNLAEKLARQHGKAGALSFFGMMGEDVQNFWIGIAQQLIDHASEWQDNEGSSCILSLKEKDRLAKLARSAGLVKYKKEKEQ